ncbi:MAG: hypothetical protein VXV96_04475 [Bdellovibrionota bacterium]|nr:hypothetical protein [Bdellovibrionota bacterium]
MRKLKFDQQGFSLVSVLVAAGLVAGISLAIMNISKQSTTVQRDFTGKMEVDTLLTEIRAALAVPENCTETFQGRRATDDSSNPALNNLKIRNNAGVFIDRFLVNEKYGQGIIEIRSFALSDPGIATDDVDVAAEGTTYLKIQFYLGKAASREDLTRKIKLKVDVDGSGNIVSCSGFSQNGGLWNRNPGDDTEIYYNTGNIGVGVTDPEASLDVSGGIKVGNSTACNASLNGLMRFDGTSFSVCEGGAWKPVTRAGMNCPSGEFLQGFNPDGSLNCQAANTLSTTQSFQITAGNGTTSASQALGNWKFCALAGQRTTADDSNNYDNCQVTGSFNSTWNLNLTKHSEDQLWCRAMCIR